MLGLQAHATPGPHFPCSCFQHTLFRPAHLDEVLPILQSWELRILLVAMQSSVILPKPCSSWSFPAASSLSGGSGRRWPQSQFPLSPRGRRAGPCSPSPALVDGRAESSWRTRPAPATSLFSTLIKRPTGAALPLPGNHLGGSPEAPTKGRLFAPRNLISETLCPLLARPGLASRDELSAFLPVPHKETRAKGFHLLLKIFFIG